MRNKLELISPGGSMEKIEYAYHYGADAVYAGLSSFSLRSRLNDFTEAKLAKTIELARSKNKKIYFTLNIYAHENHLPKLKKHLKFIKKAKPDAVIISDPGIIGMARKIAPKIKIHISTQANTTNSEAVKFWQKQGVSRIILAREVTLEEIKKIKKACPEIELEYFVHGAMCMSYSGRCLLSRWMVGRGANLGDCVQPCRWAYQSRRLECPIPNFSAKGGSASGGQFPNKSKAPNIDSQKDKRIIIEEDKHGAYFLNSKDLCLIGYLSELKKAGVNAFKIEGRTKSIYYVSATAAAYRRIINAINGNVSKEEVRQVVIKSKKELGKIANRGYSSGFLFGKDEWENDIKNSHAVPKWQFVGQVVKGEMISGVYLAKSPALPEDSRGEAFNRVKVHNVLKVGEKVEIITPKEVFFDKVREIRKIDGKILSSAHGGAKNIFFLRFSREYPIFALLRKKI
jgi:U32 family peptidase